MSHGNSADSWNISAGRARRLDVPDVGWSRPATRLRIVDLPHPDAPIEADELALGATVQVDVAQGGHGVATVPNVFVTPRSATTVIIGRRGASPSTAGSPRSARTSLSRVRS